MRTPGGKYFPDNLTKLPIWFLWRLEPDKSGRITKIPYSARYNGRASSTDPQTWATFDQVVEKLQKNRSFYKGIGVGVQKSDRLIFIDIDHCVDEEGELSGIALDILHHLPGQFVEISQSGSGLHILALGEIPRNFKNSKNGVEIYSEKRFCSMTGNSIGEGSPHEDPDGVRYVFETYKTPEKPKTPVRTEISALQRDDRWIIEHASKNRKFSDLYSGNWATLYGSQSEADLSLCNYLAFWTDCNPDQMDRIFRSSGLYREKWDRRDYREETIGLAISNCSQTLSEFVRKEDDEFGKAFLERW